MLDLIPQGWPDIFFISCITGATVLLIVVAVLAIQDAREKQIKKLIDYAIFELKKTSILPINDTETFTINPSTVSDMEDKLHNLGDKLQGKTIMGKPIRDKSGKFTKEKN